MIQSALKVLGLNYLGHGPLLNCQKLTCTQSVGAIFKKLDPTFLNGVSLAMAATKVSKGAKIRNRYNQVPHLTQDTNGKVTNSQ